MFMKTYRYLKEQCPTSLGAVLVLSCGVVESHVLDLHFRTPSDFQLEDEASRKRENERANSALQDAETTKEEKMEALTTLNDNGEVI